MHLIHRDSLVRLVIILTVTVSFGGVRTFASAQGGELRPADLGKVERVVIRGANVAMAQPAGFVVAADFPGFQQAETGSSIMVTALPAPFDKTTAGMTARGLKRRGMMLVSRKRGTFDGHRAILLNVTQRAYGRDYEKWMLVLGDAKATVMATATFPRADAKKLSAPLRRAVLTLEWRRGGKVDPYAALGFRITPDGLMFAGRVGHNVMFTRNGEMPLKKATDPLFIAGRSHTKVSAGDPIDFASNRLRATASLRDVTDVNCKTLTLDGLQAVESTAGAKDRKTGVALRAYQMIVFKKGGGYFLMIGFVGEAGAAPHIARFRRTAMSFRRGGATAPLSAADRRKQARAKHDTDEIAKAVKMFYLKHARLPATLDDLKEEFEGDELPRDPWGNRYLYRRTGKRDFDISSLGADAKPGGEGINRDLTTPSRRR